MLNKGLQVRGWAVNGLTNRSQEGVQTHLSASRAKAVVRPSKFCPFETWPLDDCSIIALLLFGGWGWGKGSHFRYQYFLKWQHVIFTKGTKKAHLCPHLNHSLKSSLSSWVVGMVTASRIKDRGPMERSGTFGLLTCPLAYEYFCFHRSHFSWSLKGLAVWF